MKNLIIVAFIIILIGAGAYLFTRSSSTTFEREEVPPVAKVEEDVQPPKVDETPKVEEQVSEEPSKETVIGSSAGKRPITAYHYGTGEREILFVGGIHGGYEWNTTLLAYELMDYLEENPETVPENVRVTIIPVLNPDGLSKVVETGGRFVASDITASLGETIPGRFNGNTVDLNRNFDCEWASTGVWQNRTVSGGSAAFSEPESQAIRDYVEAHTPSAVVVWYSAAGGVFSSNCRNGVLPDTAKLTALYANASGYPAHETFDFYAITGDMVNWLAKEGVPAISVLLTNHTDTEWEKNLKGVEAILSHYAE